MSPIRRAWPYGGAARHGPEGCGDQLPIWSAMSIVASVRPSYRRRNGVYIISLMDVTRPTRSSLSNRKEGIGKAALGQWIVERRSPPLRRTWSIAHKISPRPCFSSCGNCRPGCPNCLPHKFWSFRAAPPSQFRRGRRTDLSARGTVPPIPEVPGRVLTPDSSKRLHIHAVPSSSMPARLSLDTSPDDPRALLRAACPVSDARQLVLYPTPW